MRMPCRQVQIYLPISAAKLKPGRFPSFLQENPNSVVICGGDFNQLKTEEFSSTTGLEIVVDFPARGNSTLDYCCTNRPDLFGKCFPINTLTKTDHRGVVLPAGKILKPLIYKYELRDKRDCRKLAFERQIHQYDWNSVLQPSVENSVNELNSTILWIMNHCFPVKKVTMSSCDPYWMTPTIKILLKKRANLLARGKTTEAELLNSRLSELINRVRKGSTSDAIGSRKWWKKIDQMSYRKAEADLNLNNHFTEELNDYFAKVCFDNSYVALDPVYVSADITLLKYNETEVFVALSNAERTATGPDEIPFWIWRDYADVFAQVVTTIRNY